MLYLQLCCVYSKMNYLQSRMTLVSILILGGGACYGQNASLSGNVQTETGDGIPGVLVQLEGAQGTVTGISGHFAFANLKPGQYTISTSSVGFQRGSDMVHLENGQEHVLTIALVEEATHLNEVMVVAKSEARQLRESVASVAVLETKQFYTMSSNTSDVVKQISGVNVRQTGGFGSESEISINGMSGKQVKFFLDGIPLSYFGSGLGLNVLPVNLMQQIEVYKGVVPVHLGADALGGAINIIPRKAYNSYLDASYSLGSFNSHKVNINGQLMGKSNFFLGVNSFFNHSDNNYQIDVEIPNEFGNPEPAKVRRFHDEYSNYMISVYAGVYDEPFADRLIVSTRFSGLNDDIQHNAVMSQPYGEVTYDESTLGASIGYEKQDILPQTTLKWYGGLNYSTGHFMDTTLNAYTWDGEVYRRRTDGGEISTSRTLLTLNSTNSVSRFNVHHQPWRNGRLTLNVFTSWFCRSGKDPVAAEFYGQDYFSHPTVLVKNATGIGYEHTIHENFASYTAFKHFTYSSDGYAIQNLEFLPHHQAVSNMGYSQSFRYSLSNAWLIKTSYEYATRLPDEIELFGNFTLIRPNPYLEPEQSHNANLGVLCQTNKFHVEISGFYRTSDNIIWLRTSQFFAQYQNLLKAVTKGMGAELQYQPLESLKLKANVTYQDIRNRSPKNVTGTIDDRYYDARLPNKPYLFGNAEVRYHLDDFLGERNRWSFSWTANYVHQFYLFWAEDGDPDLKNSIPAQFIQNIGMTYAQPENRLSVTLQTANLFDNKAYDNFSVQRPGRAFYLTLRTYITKNLN